MGRGSGDPSQARQRLRWPRPLFLLQQRRLVKGKDVGGGGGNSGSSNSSSGGGRGVSRDLGGTLAQPGARAPPPRPSAGGKSRWGRSARWRSVRARVQENGKRDWDLIMDGGGKPRF